MDTKRVIECLKGIATFSINFYQSYKVIIFWVTFLFTTILSAVVGFQLAHFLEVSNFLGNFKNLPKWVQEILSLQGKWAEALANLFVPFFIILSIKFYALSIKESRKKWLFKVLPILPYLSFLSRTPILFIQGTGSILSGFIIYLLAEFPFIISNALLLIFPIMIMLLSIAIRALALDNLSKVGGFTKKHKNKLGLICLFIACIFWLYANVITLIFELKSIFSNLT
jgi:hypothetical protein